MRTSHPLPSEAVRELLCLRQAGEWHPTWGVGGLRVMVGTGTCTSQAEGFVSFAFSCVFFQCCGKDTWTPSCGARVKEIHDEWGGWWISVQTCAIALERQ